MSWEYLLIRYPQSESWHMDTKKQIFYRWLCIRLTEGQETIYAHLAYKGTVTDEVRLMVTENKDLDVLRSWLKLAVESDSVEQFEAKASRRMLL